MARIDIELADGNQAGTTLLDLTKQANTLNKEIRKLKPGSEEFINKSKELQGVSKRIGDVKNEIRGTTDASNKLKDAFIEIVPFGNQFKALTGKVTGVKDSVGGLTSASGLLRKAMLAIPILLVVAALTSLVSWFTSTQEGMDKVTSVTRPLLAVFAKMKGVVQELGGSVFKGLALILNGELKEGLKTMGQGFVDAVRNTRTAIDEGWEAGKRLDDLQKQIEKAEIKQIVRSKELDLVIKENKAIVEDTTRSYLERTKAAEAARKAQDELERTEVELIDLKIAKLKEQQALNDTSREDEKELAELVARRLEVQARITEQAIEFDKKITEINAQRKAEEEREQAVADKFTNEFFAKQEERAQFEQDRKDADASREAERIKKSMILTAKKLENDLAAMDAEHEKRKELADAIAMMEQEKIALFNEGTNAVIGLLSADANARKKNAEAIKAFTVGQIAVNLQNEISGLFASFSTLGPFGQAAAILRAAFSTARAVASIKRVSSQKFEWGGVLQGPSHRQGGIPIEAEGDEIVLTKGVYRNPALRRVASQINYMAGGRKFEAGGPVNPLSGSASSVGAGAAANQIIDLSPFVNEIREMKNSIDARFDRIKVQNVVTETADKLKVVNTIVDEANV